MQFIKTDNLKPGMRLAKPIYNKMGVLLYERETSLTQQGIVSIRNFGLIGIFVLEPAEPAPPLTQEELDFERFQTVYMFKLRDELSLIRQGKTPTGLYSLAQSILKEYGQLGHRINFTQNIRSTDDYYFKHSLNVAILCAMISNRMKMSYEQQLAIVIAALLHDNEMDRLPEAVKVKNSRQYSKEDVAVVSHQMQESYLALSPDDNLFDLPENSLRILYQISRSYYHPKFPPEEKLKYLPGTRVLIAANEYDSMTAMNLNKEPVSEIAAIKFLREFPDYYDINVIRSLTECIHIVPRGCCVELSNGERGMVVEANPQSFMTPVVLLFSNNKLYDLSNPTYGKSMQIVDIMRTMDNRIQIDEHTLEQFTSDSALQKTLDRMKEKRLHSAPPE